MKLGADPYLFGVADVNDYAHLVPTVSNKVSRAQWSEWEESLQLRSSLPHSQTCAFAIPLGDAGLG